MPRHRIVRAGATIFEEPKAFLQKFKAIRVQGPKYSDPFKGDIGDLQGHVGMYRVKGSRTQMLGLKVPNTIQIKVFGT